MDDSNGKVMEHFYRPLNFTEKHALFKKKFSYSDYQEAHKWLDEIFINGCPIDTSLTNTPSVCQSCGGYCCHSDFLEKYTELYQTNPLLTNGKIVPIMAWNEDIYFKDPEFIDGDHHAMVCHRKDGAHCTNKMIMCKVHPFYPAKIHILEEECNYAIYLSCYSKDRRMCTAIEYEAWQLRELSQFYQWLYGEFPENRIIYILYSMLHFDGSPLPNSELADGFLKGIDFSVNIIYRP